MNTKFIYHIIMALCLTGVASCTKFDDYMKYVKDGEIIYPQKADLVRTFPGRNRVQLQWITVDPRVTSFKVIYSQSSQKDSISVPVVHSSKFNVDTIRTIVAGLEETSYTFRIISYDAADNSSLVVEADESSYGELYEKRLLNRAIKSKSMSADGMTINWYDPSEEEVGIELTYTTKDGDKKTVKLPESETTTSLADIDAAYPFTYRTLYKPKETAIDVFTAPEVELKIQD